MMMRYVMVLLAGLWLTAGLAQAEIYKYYDKNGNLVLTDTPPEGAERVETKPLMTIPALSPEASARANNAPDVRPRAANTTYAIVIQMPQRDATYQRNLGESIPFAYSVDPALSAGHVLETSLDGKVTSESSVSSESLERGTHEFVVKVRDEKGLSLIHI